MLKAVIFDMDGVIIDSEPFHLEVNREIFRELNIPFIMEEYENYIGVSNDEMWADIKMKNNLSLPVSYLKELQVRKDMEYLLSAEEKPIPGVLELLKELRLNGLAVALASSSSLKYIGIVLEKFRIRDFFDAVVSGENMRKGKPAPDIFLHTAKLLDVGPTSCLVIEDSRNGVAAAKAAGMKCIGFQNPSSGAQDVSAADFITGSLAQINLELIESL